MTFPPKFHSRDGLVASKHILYFLSASGLFSLPPFTGKNFAYEIIYDIYFIVVTSFTGMVTIFTAVDLFGRLEDVSVIADHGVMLASLIVILVKQNPLVRHKRLIEIWVVEIQRRYKAANEIERSRLNEADEAAVYYIKIFAFIWLLITASWLLPLYLGRPGQFELPTINAAFFGVDSVLAYYFLYGWNVAALSLAVFSVFAIDVFMVGAYSQATSRLQALGDAFENIGADNIGCGEHEAMRRCDYCRSSVRQFVTKSVAEHCDVMKFVGELNRVFYWTLLVQSVFVAVIVAGCGFYGLVSILHGNIPSFVKSMMYIFGVICETWIYCKFGDRLKYASLNVAEALWKSHWYTLAKEERLSVSLIMRACENPLYMASGMIFRMDLEHLGFILSSAYSYFTVLRSFA